jgi:hypothetical protein
MKQALRPRAEIDGLTPEQRFFLAFVQGSLAATQRAGIW